MGKANKTKSDWWKFLLFVIGGIVVLQLPEPWGKYIAAILGLYVLSRTAQFFEAMNDKLDEIIDLLNAQASSEDSFD